MPVRAPLPVCRPQACSTPPHTAPGLDSVLRRKIKGDLTYDFSEHSVHPRAETATACALCDSTQYLQIHHIIPRGKGGNNEPGHHAVLQAPWTLTMHPEGWTMTAEDVNKRASNTSAICTQETGTRWNKRVSILSSKRRGRVPPTGLSKLAPPPRSSARAALFLSGVRRCGATTSSGPPPSTGPSLRGCRPCAAAALASLSGRALFWGGAWCAALSRFPLRRGRGLAQVVTLPLAG